MNSTTKKEKDPMGHAIKEFFTTGKATKLRVFSSQFYEDEIPVATLFRTYEQMPPQEKEAVRLLQAASLKMLTLSTISPSSPGDSLWAPHGVFPRMIPPT